MFGEFNNMFKSLEAAFSNSDIQKSNQSFTTNTFVGPGNAQHMGQTAKDYTREGYEANVIVYRCIELIAEGVGAIPLRVFKGDKEAPDHPLQKLLDKPNTRQSYSNFAEEFTAYKLITGTSFAEAILAGSIPMELNVWQPYEFKVVKPRTLSPLALGWVYEYGQLKRTWDVDQLTGQSDLNVWKTFNPFDSFFGMSPIRAAAFSVDQHNAGGEWNLRMLQNDMSPSGVLSSESSLTEAQFKRMKDDIESAYSGHQNAKKPLLLENGMTWQQMAMSAKEMDFIKGLNMSAQQIAAAYGIPLQVIPIPGSQTFANYAEARLALYEDVILPETKNLIQQFIQWLFPYYPDADQLSIRPNLDDIDALAPRRKEKYETANSSTFMTVNEKREFVGMEKLTEEGADEVWMPGGLLPLSDMMDEDLGIEEEPVVTGEEDDESGTKPTPPDGSDDDSGEDDEEGEE